MEKGTGLQPVMLSGIRATLWALWPQFGFDAEPLGLPAPFSVWGFLLWLSWLQAVPPGLGGEPGSCVWFCSVKFEGEGEVEGKG